MLRIMTSKPVLVAGALAARKKIMESRARQRRRKALAVGSGLMLLSAGAAAAYKFWYSRRSEEPVEEPFADRQFRHTSIDLDAPEPIPNI